MIPDEAVDEVASVMQRVGIHTGVMQPVDVARMILEAAAPHLMAQGWDEGKYIGQTGGWNKPNPYRKPADV